MSRRDYNTRKLSFLGFNTRGDGITNPDEVQLDAEMEKVFAGVDKPDKFDVTKFTDDTNLPSTSSVPTTGQSSKEYLSTNQPTGENSSKFDEKDYDSHRKDSYPQARPTFKMRNTKSPDKENISTTTVSPTDTSSITTPSSTVTSSPTMPLSQIDEPPPQISQRPPEQSDLTSDTSSDVKHVQFNKKKERKESLQTDDSLGDDSEDQRKRRKGRHFQKHRKYSLQDYPGINRQISTDSTGRRVSVQPEDESLQEADINELTSHRSDDPRGMRRHKIQPIINSFYNNQNLNQNLHHKKIFDHSPHEVFVQLDELMGVGDEREWKETARWIKYEEDLEEGADRWGPAHVAPLSFHSLLNLRRCLETGVVLLDLEEKDLPSVAYRVVEQMSIDELISEDDKPIVMRSLLLKHRHVNEHSHRGFHFGGKRKNSSYTSLQSLLMEDTFGRRCSECSSYHSPTLTPLPLSNITRPSRRQSAYSQSINLSEDKKTKIIPINETNGHSTVDTSIDMKEEVYTSSIEDLKKIGNDTIFKRIPQGAEATTVLVGSVDFLEQPTIAFVRLAEGILMPSITEVPVPVRFLFILLGPKSADLDYHEVGRSIATLMSSKHFHDIAYKAEDRKDLLSAINEFLDDSIVLPPGDWERQALLPFEELKAKKDMIRSRKKKALQAKKNKEKQQIYVDEEKKLLAAADGPKKPPNPLERTHRLWGGLINDIKRRYPMFKSDITDGLNTETLAATIFMYFAALSTAITFGGLASDKTKNLIGISETLLSASMVGLFFHLFSGQPLVIIGTTGPLLLFDEALHEFCAKNDVKFLSVRVYIGVWLFIIALIVSALEGSVFVRLFTRFTQEIFSALITLIYIVETVLKLITVYQKHPLLPKSYYSLTETVPLITQTPSFAALTNIETTTTDLFDLTSSLEQLNTTTSDLITTIISTFNPTISTITPQLSDNDKTNEPNTALFCTILTMGTFALAYYLKLFRNSHFLGRNARRALGDFGVPISIALFVFLDFMIGTVYTDKLTVPNGISPSEPDERGWVVIDFDPKVIWIPFVAAIPALLVYILIFMETHISELIVDKPERGLKKGSGLHMDIVLLCFLNMFCGIFGMPWHCAATVRSVTHVSAVTIMSRTHAPGENPHIIDVKEQRISGFFVALMVGLSVTMAPILRLIPMSVLFGVFFYMGIASMSGVQFFERLRLLFMPVKHHPPAQFVRGVPTIKMHIFTIIQILALAILWTVKSSSISLAFPFFLILMVPLRMKMTKFFTEKEIKALDGVPEQIAGDDEPDFYEQASIPA